MNFLSKAFGAITLSASLISAFPLHAQDSARTVTAPVPTADCSARLLSADAARKHDEDVVKSVEADLAKGSGYAGLAPRLSDLQTVLDHAPATIHATWCDGTRVVYVDSPPAALLVLLEAAAAKPVTGGALQTRALSVLPYARASLYLGSWYAEHRDYRRAIAIMRMGLALAPTESNLTSEIADSLNQVGGQTEAIAICDNTLAHAFELQAHDRARVLRAKGYALGDLGRYDEAIATYQLSLANQPNHPGALNEIAYLTKRKAGAGATPGGVFTAKQAAEASTFGKPESATQPPKQ